MPGVDLADVIGIRWRVWAQGGAEVAREGYGRPGWAQMPSTQAPGAVRVTEGMPLLAGATNMDPAGASCGSSSPTANANVRDAG